jgi:hypothetical protein
MIKIEIWLGIASADVAHVVKENASRVLPICPAIFTQLISF